MSKHLKDANYIRRQQYKSIWYQLKRAIADNDTPRVKRLKKMLDDLRVRKHSPRYRALIKKRNHSKYEKRKASGYYRKRWRIWYVQHRSKKE